MKSGAPVAVHVIWWSGDTLAASLAQAIYRYCARDPRRPLERGLGLPVRFWRDISGSQAAALGLDADQHALVIPLVGAEAVLLASDALAALAARVSDSGGRHQLLPVALAASALRTPLGSYNFVSAHGRSPAVVLDAIAHELYRMLACRSGGIAPRLRLFLSHAKHDGLEIAAKLRDYLRSDTQLDSFFDANDIGYGTRFAEEIEQGAEGSALIAIQTDAYASREWCRREVLIAKRHGRPVVVVNAVQVGEARSFPYLGNVATVRWNLGDDAVERCRAVTSLALRECLRVTSFECEVESRGLSRSGDLVTAYAPELLTLASLAAAGGPAAHPKRVLYSDPPLGDEEQELLRALNPDVQTATPRMLRRADLAGRVIALSASASSDMPALGWAEEQLEDFLVEMSRYLLASGGAVAYGGDLRGGGLTEGLIELARSHDASGADDRLHLFLYWPYHREEMSTDAEAELRPTLRVHRTASPAGVLAATTVDRLRANPELAQLALSGMRHEMTAAIDARILLGGQLAGFMGRYSGLLEEAALSAAAGQPLYLVGAFGGAAQAVIRVLASDGDDHPFGSDAEPLIAKLRASRTSARDNGLTEAENLELATSTDLSRAIELIIRGLGSRFGVASS